MKTRRATSEVGLTKAQQREAAAALAAMAEEQRKAELPVKILMAMAWAHKLDVRVHVEADGDMETPRWRAVFKFPERRSTYTDLLCTDEDVTCGVEDDEWAYSNLVNTLQEHETFLTKEREGRELARSAWDSLTPEQRRALGLSQYRP